MHLYPDRFLGLPGSGLDEAVAVVVSLPFERTVSYGAGAWRAPRAILDATCQIETFDEETHVDFEEGPAIHTLPAILDDREKSIADYLETVRAEVAALRPRFVLGLGGEHTVTSGLVRGLADDLRDLTIVQIDAHADLIDELDGQRWSHGTVMRRFHEQGCRLIQIGVRSLSRAEHELCARDERIDTFYAHQLAETWGDALDAIHAVTGPVYLTIDVDGLDPAVIPSTGTPQPEGLSWRQTMEIIRAVSQTPRWLGADIVEFIASPHPPGCDLVAAKLAVKTIAFWALTR